MSTSTANAAKPIARPTPLKLEPPTTPRSLPLRMRASIDVKERDAGRRDWVCVWPEDKDVSWFDVMQPEFFGEMSAHGMRPGDHIEAHSQDLTIWGELLVVAVDEVLRTAQVVAIQGPLDLSEAIKAGVSFDFSKLAVEDMDRAGFRVRLGARVLRSGFPNRAAAPIADHELPDEGP